MRAWGSKGRSIQSGLLLLLIFIFVPILVLQTYTYYESYQSRRAEAFEANLEIARAVSTAFDSFIQNVLNQELAIGLAITSSQRMSGKDIKRLLKSSRGNPAVRDFTWMNPQGDAIHSSNDAMIGRNYSDRSYFREVANGREWMVSELIFAKTTGEPTFGISRGIRDDNGALLGIVFAAIIPEKLNTILSFERSINAGVSLIDSKGIHVVRWPKAEYTWEQRNWLRHYPVVAEVLAGKEAVTVQKSKIRGETRIVGWSPVSKYGWVSAASRAEEDVVAPIISAMLPQIFFLLVTVSLTIMAALALARPMVTAVRKLRDQALALGRGQMETIEIASGPSEMKDLSTAFNHMADEVRLRETKLQKAKDELEERVKERTYELYAESLYARNLIEASPDPLVTISVDGKITDVNHASEKVTGVPRGQLIGSDFSDYFTEPEKARAGYEQVFRQGFVQDYPLELKRQDGHVTPVLYNASVYRDDTGQIMGVFAAARDITKRKQAEAKQRRLASELSMAEERERKRIAGVLHDDIAQTLATVRMRLDMLQGITSDQNDQQTLKEAKKLLVQSLQETRALMNDLGNPVLFDLGPKAACEALANQLMERHPVRISCEIREAFMELNPDVKTILFQAVKELLNNVVKHSQAHNAHVMIDIENRHLRVKVTDDGVGFDPQALGAPTVEGGFGLYNVRERLIAIGGSLGIESIPGTGTVVTAILPIELD